MAEKNSTEKKTIKQKLHAKKISWMRRGYKFATRKIIFPLTYAWAARKPIIKNKVVFVETRLSELDPNCQILFDRLKEDGKYTLSCNYLRIDFSRYREEYKRGLKFVKNAATANFVVMSDACGTYSCVRKRKGSYAIQLWHGCGAFKKFGFSTSELLFGADRKHKERYPAYANLDLVTVSSPEVIWAYEEAMGLKDQDIVKALGVCRTDAFFDNNYIDAAYARVRKLVPEMDGKKVILYAPTFRGKTRYAEGPDKLDIERMMEKLGDEYVLLIKHHPFVKNLPSIPAKADKFAFDVSRNSDIQDLICVADICISDYSSLIYEYSLFGKPMIFFAYDYKDYCDWRGFYYNYDELTPGPIVGSTEEIINFVSNIDSEFNEKAIHAFREKFMGSCNGKATERVVEWMEAH